MENKVYFRADAGPDIGYGHFVRTLALADMLKNTFDCVFFTQDPTDYQRRECEKVCELIALPSGEEKLELFEDYLIGDETVVLDNYFFTTEYQRRIKKKGCKLVCVDDLHDKHYVADAVVNHGPARPDEFDCESYTRLCLGPQWSMLRRPFLEPVKTRKRNNQIVVCFGGADPLRLTDRIVSYLFELGVGRELVVVLGDTVYLSDLNRDRVTVKQNLNAWQMAELFETSCLGILPASSVRIEAVSRGLKVICGYYVENHKIGFERSLAQKDIVPVYDFKDLTLRKLESALDAIDYFSFTIPDYSKVPERYIGLMSAL